MKKYLLICLLPGLVFADNLNPAGMTQVMSGVDDKAVSVEMGHTFPWLDKIFTHAWFSTNGFIMMYNPTADLPVGVGRQDAPPGGYCCDGYSHATGMPTYMANAYHPSGFSYMIAPLWTDLDDTSTDSDAGYYYRTDSDSTSFLWRKVREYATTNENTFGVTLDRTGGFKFEYEKVNVSFHHKAFVGWYGGPVFSSGTGTNQAWTQEYSMNGFTTDDILNYGGPSSFSVNDGTASLIMSESTLGQEQGGGGGGQQAAAPPTYAEQAVDTVFGDSADDFLHLDQPDATGRPRILSQLQTPQIYQEAPQEQMFTGVPRESRQPTGEPESQQEAQRQQVVVEVVQAREERVEELSEPVAQIARVERPQQTAPEPVVVAAEPVVVQAQAEPAVVVQEAAPAPAVERAAQVTRPAVDVVGYVMSLQNNVAAPVQTADNTSNSGLDAQPVLGVQQADMAINIQAEQQQENGLTQQDLAPPSQVQFETDFNDAIATGQSLGQFLSAQLPDFSRFDVAPPTAQEQRTVQRAETQIQSMSQQDIDNSLEAQLENLGDSGGFTDQSLAVFLISNNPGFSQYGAVTINDRDQFYESTQVYPGNAPREDPRGLLRITGTTGYNDLVNLQWQR